MNRLLEIARNGWAYGTQAVWAGSSEARSAARSHIRRRIALSWLGRVRNEITFERNGFVWTGPVHCTITRAIFIDGRHQDAYIDSLIRWIDASRPVIVNVGANLGDTALPLSRICKRVIAIEPSPETFARLERNIRQNGLERAITPLRAAISAKPGTAQMVIASQPGNTEILGQGGQVGFDGLDLRRDVVSVETIPLDDAVASLGIQPEQIAFVWSDTQGFESEVIESGAGIWRNGSPLWVEVWPKGLDCHGGSDRFVDLCERHFTHFYDGKLLAGPPQPISALKALVAELKANNLTGDILLLPGCASTEKI